MNDVSVMPSIFGADFFNLEKVIALFEKVKVDAIHFDIMDNHYVPNISFGAKVAEDILKRTNLPSFFHFMVELDENPEKTLKQFLNLRIDHWTFHVENEHVILKNYINFFKRKGKKIGLSIKPKTPIEQLSPFLEEIDLILVMSVEPGFSGQSFLKESLSRIERVKNIIDGKSIIIQVDGGINRKNYKDILRAGAKSLVIGSNFYEDKKVEEWVEEIRNFS
ncbi:MAG: ribulose-phosphate 3-epimerase [Brevinematales bacterium]|nr:ribulose-phosphate 3-epimerase [Brevinematales bacterium]